MKYGDRPMLIDGELVRPSGEWIVTSSPSTEEPLGRVPAGTRDDLNAAVMAALDAQKKWARLSIWERGVYLRDLAQGIKARSDEIRAMEAEDSGNTIANLHGDLRKASHHLEYFSGLATEMKGETIPASADGLHFTIREPYGVVGRIVPFNHPFMFATANLAAPLVAGNAVVIKSPETSPLTATIMAELCAKHLPPGVVNLVSGFGLPVGDAIARHPDIRRIGFTGSVSTGLAVQRAASETCVKHISLELGGKNAQIICPDVNLEAAVADAVSGMNFGWAGQSCGSTSRILVHESQYEEAVSRAKSRLESIKVGDPSDPASQMGPLNSKAQYDRVMKLITSAQATGARLVTGGRRQPGFDRGYFIAPTLFADVTPDMQIARDEIFGPVMTFIKWSTTDEALEIANRTAFGLTASIYSNDLKTVMKFARGIRAGVIAVNSTKMHFVGTPFGGMKNSGIGHEEAISELLSYSESKTVHLFAGF